MQYRGSPNFVPWSGSSSHSVLSYSPHTSPHYSQSGNEMNPSVGPYVAALSMQQFQATTAVVKQPSPHVGANVGAIDFTTKVRPHMRNPSVMPFQQTQAQVQQPIIQMYRKLQSTRGLHSLEEPGRSAQGVQEQPNQLQQMDLQHTDRMIGLRGVSDPVGNPRLDQSLSLPDPEPSSRKEKLEQMHLLYPPTSPQKQLQMLHLIRSDPTLMIDYIKIGPQRLVQQALQQRYHAQTHSPHPDLFAATGRLTEHDLIGACDEMTATQPTNLVSTHHGRSSQLQSCANQDMELPGGDSDKTLVTPPEPHNEFVENLLQLYPEDYHCYYTVNHK